MIASPQLLLTWHVVGVHSFDEYRIIGSSPYISFGDTPYVVLPNIWALTLADAPTGPVRKMHCAIKYSSISYKLNFTLDGFAHSGVDSHWVLLRVVTLD